MVFRNVLIRSDRTHAHHRSKISDGAKHTCFSFMYAHVCVLCSVTISKETSFFVAYFLLFFVLFWLKFSLTTFPSFCVVFHFLVTRRLLYHHRKRGDTSAPREREIKRERFEREVFDSRGETRLVNARAQNLKNTTFRSSSHPETRKNR